jgi:hypothetical protein
MPSSLGPLQNYIDRLCQQVEFLPKLRAGLQELVDQLDEVIGEESEPARKAPAPRVSVNGAMTAGEAHLKRGEVRAGGVRRTQRFLKKMPPGGRTIPTVDKRYRFVPNLGVVSRAAGGRIQLLWLSKSGWNLKCRDASGFMSITRLKLAKLLKVPVKELGV